MSARNFAFALLVLIAATFAALGQQTLGIIKGRVLDESGAVIPGAKITVSAGQFTRSTTSGSDGSFTMVGVPTGVYSVTAAAPGLAQFQNSMIQVNAGGTVNVDLQLRVQTQTQQVTVQDTAGTQVSTDPSANVGAIVLHSEDLAALSDDPDDLADDLQALAGPSAGPNGGQLFIDGFTGGRLPPKESIREVRINQNPVSAEYDKLGYGRIEIFTKPGTDKIRGSAFYNISDGALNSRNPYSANKADFRSQSYGGNFSGPLGRKASYFLDAERRANDDNAVVNATILDANLNRTVFNQAFVTPHSRTTFSPRLDYQLSPNVTLMGRYTWTQFDNPIQGIGTFNLPSQASSSTMTQQSLQATETWVMNSKAINETRFQYQRNRTDTGAPFQGPTISVMEAFVGGGASAGFGYSNTNSYEFQNYTSVSHGAHTLRFGARARASQLSTSSQTNFNGTFSFSGLQAPELDANNQPTGQTIQIDSLESYRRTLLFQQLGYSPAEIRKLGGGASQFTRAGGNPAAGVDQVDIGIFAQDDWRVKPNLTLSLGLRYETQTNIHDWRDIAPRIGIAWAPGGSAKGARPKTVIRAGSGIFYDRFDDSYTLAAIRFNGENQQQFTIRNPDFFPTAPSIADLQSTARPLTLREVDRQLRAPYIIQSAIGIERQLPGNSAFAVTFTNSRGVHMLRTRNINAPLPGTNVLPYPTLGPLDLYESSGILNQNQIMTNFNTRFSRRVTMNLGYSYNRAKSNVDSAGFPSNQYDLSTEYGRSNLDMRHRMFLMGSLEAKYGIRVSPFVIINSGRPFNITTGRDNNGDQVFTDRPAFAAPAEVGLPNIVATRFGVFNTAPGLNDVLIPRNFGDGPGAVSFNMRLSKSFAFGPERSFAGPASGMGGGGGGAHGGHAGGGGGRGGMGGGGMRMGGMGGGMGEGAATASNRRYNITLSANVRNLLNHTNPGPYIGNLTSPLFGQANSLGGGFHGGSANNRGIDFSLRFNF
jgi:hypothetical protein